MGQYNVRAISLTLGHLSSEIVDIRLESADKNFTSCSKHIGGLKNSTTIFCSADSVAHVVVHAANRLHLCSFKVYAINARKLQHNLLSWVIFFLKYQFWMGIFRPGRRALEANKIASPTPC